jgi:hypothetical protein
VREVEAQMPFEEWIYGDPPQPVEFVRINGNRVIRVEIAKVGEAPQIFEKDEVESLMRTDGTPVITAEQQKTRTVQMGDVQRDPDRQAPAPPPTLTAPGEKVPDVGNNPAAQMKPVQFPKQKPDDYPDVAAARRADEAKAAEAGEKDKSAPADSAKEGSKPSASGPLQKTHGQGDVAPATAPAKGAPPVADQEP